MLVTPLNHITVTLFLWRHVRCSFKKTFFNSSLIFAPWEVEITTTFIFCFEGFMFVHELPKLQSNRDFLVSLCRRTLRLWSLETRECLQTFVGHKDAVLTLKVGNQDENYKSWQERIKGTEKVSPIHTLFHSLFVYLIAQMYFFCFLPYILAVILMFF